ncbi:GDP-mannose-dependent alpha-(1-6)-phosphatidylinositol monomannoside mannosyltransferase [Comamonas testosteroni]|uniref:GDP-mannose-dependent alpha-(1-6)-phosphatidylinositol monomannoside mannosyltransferase n=2 Tax=Comamonas testosteroni TaxID=285 RepID=A0A8B4SAZ6_COMTE|nr:GDP-mannose-dependent alpha-(1-6)-phosphatidylinositol monomannoside mannosyltransferase [Comamonas testosteroni]
MLLKLLQQIDRGRFTPTVISLIGLGEVGPKIQALNIPVYSLDMSRGVPNPLVVLRLAKLLRQLQPEVVHTWMYHADLLGGLAARLAGFRKVIWCIRHSNLSKTENKRSTLWVVKACALLSHRVPVQMISCSQRAKEVHAAVGYAADKLHVIPNGFDLSRFVPDVAARASVRAELGLAADVPLVGLIARFDSQKNHCGFVEAAAQVHAQMPDVHFVLAGTGVDAANIALNSAIAVKGLQARMHLLGRREDVPRLMASLDVLASSSHGEAFPNVLGEAMACGVPCVVTDVGDSAEIVGDTGCVVAAGDMVGLARGLVDVLSYPPEQKTVLGEQARVRVAARYEIGHVARLYEAFYERVARGDGL